MPGIDSRAEPDRLATEPARARFAQQLLRSAARPERIAEVIAEIVGDRIEVGPVQAGPGALVCVTATGRPGDVRAEVYDGEEWDIAVEVPLSLRLQVDFAGVLARFAAAVRVRMRVQLVPQDPCAVFVRTEEVTEEHVEVRLRAVDRPARLLGRVGDVRCMVAEHIVAYIGELLSSPQVRELRRIDIAQVIERAWEAGLVIAPAARPMTHSA
ncbi:hypothetical protein [Nocardia sp. CY41]|uniref:hypothetical protein n=1 Tax=Nocardia sp. CY41 TaxID=2608686 RepID=UPI00135A0113|nr:hypothetical protein [Nocardia sp. CY41]